MNQPNKAFLLIECQNEWLADTGKLNHLMLDRDQFNQSKEQIKIALAYARKNKYTIIHSGLSFSNNYAELANGKSGLHQAIPRAMTFGLDTHGCKFYEDFEPYPSEFIPSGRLGSSAFTGSNLDLFLRNNKIEEVFIVGYAMHVCVESTLRDAHERGYHPILISDASSTFTSAQKDHVINSVISHFGHHITTQEFINN